MPGDSTAAKWTEEEKLGLVASLLFPDGRMPSLTGIKLPEGRTAKACRHVLGKLKEQYGSANAQSEAKQGGNDEDDSICGSVPNTPKGAAAAAAKKRKAAGAGAESKAKKVKTAKAGVKDEEDTSLEEEAV